MANNRLITAASVLLLLGSLASAQTYLLPWNCISSGGSPGTGTGYQLNATIGQAVQWNGTGTGLLGYWGFWVPMASDTNFGWREKKPMPLAPSTKYIKDGGWLAFNSGTVSIYAAKGNKTSDFYSYSLVGDSWRALHAWPNGSEAKTPSKGSVGCSNGNGVLYATKGNNTQGFWAYYAVGDSWSQKANVPLGPSNKKVKGGTDLAFASDCAYLLKGYRNEFWKYSSDGDSWHQLPNAPAGVNVKYDKGSWLAYDDVNKKIYAFKAKYHEFYAYDITADTWGPALAPMPVVGSAGSKKAKDGSCGAWKTGNIYALKGGNTQEFWKYSISGNSWVEMETIPAFGVTGKKKKVKAGGDLVTATSALYATKGNKCNELWKYLPRSGSYGADPTPGREGVAAAPMALGDAQFLRISPNPLAGGFAALRYGLPKAGTAELHVFDVTGRSVLSRTLAGRSGAVSLDLRHLSAGVYLVKLVANDFSRTQKLVVQR